MGSDALRAAVEAEGGARVSAILRAAETQASRLDREASSRATQRRERELRDLEVQLRREARTRIARARSEARKLVFDARDEFIRCVLDGARDLLSVEGAANLSRDEIARWAEQALDHMPPGGSILFECSTDFAPLLESALANYKRVQVRCDPDLPVGFRATGSNGAIVVDATLSGRLEMDRPRLAIEILRRFESAQTEPIEPAGGA